MERRPTPTILIGDIIDGYCHGEFGRDGYGLKRVEGVGIDWVVARDEGGRVFFASGDGIHQNLAPFCLRFLKT